MNNKKLPPALAQLERIKREHSRNSKSKKKGTKLPQEESVGEATLALHLKASNIAFQSQVALCTSRRWKWDFAIQQAGLRTICIDVQGGTFSQGGHVRGVGYQNDIDKHNAALLVGAIPVWFTTDDTTSGRAIAFIEQLIASPHRSLGVQAL